MITVGLPPSCPRYRWHPLIVQGSGKRLRALNALRFEPREYRHEAGGPLLGSRPRTVADLAFPAILTFWSRLRRLPPNLTPLVLAAANAAFVRALIISRSCSAIAARMWIVSRFAWGIDSHELDARVHQAGRELDVTSQPVQLGNDECRSPRAAQVERTSEPRGDHPICRSLSRRSPRQAATGHHSDSRARHSAELPARDHSPLAVGWRRGSRRRTCPVPCLTYATTLHDGGVSSPTPKSASPRLAAALLIPRARLCRALVVYFLGHRHGAHHEVFLLRVGTVGVSLHGIARHVRRPVVDLDVFSSHRAAFERERDDNDDERNQTHDSEKLSHLGDLRHRQALGPKLISTLSACRCRPRSFRGRMSEPRFAAPHVITTRVIPSRLGLNGDRAVVNREDGSPGVLVTHDARS